jgi:predicted sugar kinase
MKIDFEPYRIGAVFNPLDLRGSFTPKFKEISIKFPSRLNAMAIDPSKITTNKNMIYTPGEVVFSIKLYANINVKTTSKKGQIKISKTSKRRNLIKHAVMLMRNTLKDNSGLEVEVDNDVELKHAGLGSSSRLISGVATAINEIYGSPVTHEKLARYVAQNHGEEIDRDNENLNPVQCIGGSAVSGLYSGGLFVITGETVVVGKMDISADKKVVLGIPKNYKEVDSKSQFDEEKKNLDKFLKTGKKYGSLIAYKILHQGLPSMKLNNLKPMGDIIYEYRFNMGSIKNCSYVYPPMVEITNNLRSLKEKQLVDVLAISSIGPTIFAITNNTFPVLIAFKEQGLETRITEIENDRYKVLSKQ